MLFCLLKKSLQDKPFEKFFLPKNQKKVYHNQRN